MSAACPAALTSTKTSTARAPARPSASASAAAATACPASLPACRLLAVSTGCCSTSPRTCTDLRKWRSPGGGEFARSAQAIPPGDLSQLFGPLDGHRAGYDQRQFLTRETL